MKKRLICLLLAGMTCLSLVGCSSSVAAGKFDKFFEVQYTGKGDKDKEKNSNKKEDNGSSSLMGDYNDESLTSDTIQTQLQSEGIWTSSTGLEEAANELKYFVAYALFARECLNEGYSYENGDPDNPFGTRSSGDNYSIDFGLEYDDYSDNGQNHQIDSFSGDLGLSDGSYIASDYSIKLRIVPGTKDIKIDSKGEKILKAILPDVDINEVNSKINEALEFERNNTNDDYKRISIEVNDKIDIDFFAFCWSEYDSVTISISKFISV